MPGRSGLPGNNATVSVSGYGVRKLVVLALEHGINLEANEEFGKYGRTFYLIRRPYAPFILNVVFTNYDEREAFVKWMEGYYKSLSENTLGVMLVSVPARGFRRFGIPTAMLPHGDKIGAISYKFSLQFETVQETSGALISPLVSRFALGKKGANISAAFFPSGDQAGGRAEDGIYGSDSFLTGDPDQTAGAGIGAALDGTITGDGGVSGIEEGEVGQPNPPAPPAAPKFKIVQTPSGPVKVPL